MQKGSKVAKWIGHLTFQQYSWHPNSRRPNFAITLKTVFTALRLWYFSFLGFLPFLHTTSKAEVEFNIYHLAKIKFLFAFLLLLQRDGLAESWNTLLCSKIIK